MDLDNIHGLMDVSIKETILKEKEMEKEKWYIKINKNMMEIGKMVKNMVKVSIDQLTNNLLGNGIEDN